jgi:small subunit ribosomal protein S6
MPALIPSWAERSQEEVLDVPLYETVFIARQDIAAPQVDALADTFQKAIEGLGGKVSKRESWGLRNLSFRIKKNRKGQYVLLNIDSPPAAIQEMERQMRINEDVLRYLTVRVEALEDGPSVMMQSRHSSDERPRRDHGDRPPRDEYRPRRGGDEARDRGGNGESGGRFDEPQRGER